jgi:thiamine-phosphate pyrophosphorylase
MSDLPASLPQSRLYLVTPAGASLATFPDLLAQLLDAFPVACVRLASAGHTEDALMRAADTLRGVCHARDVPLLITDHFRLATRLGLDGVHLSEGARQVRAARKDLLRDTIVGAHARASRHDGMTAAEIGADYVSVGPLTPSSLGDGTLAPLELFAWWAEMIEVPLVAEGGLTPDLAEDLAQTADFLALGEELWTHPKGPEPALKEFSRRLG